MSSNYSILETLRKFKTFPNGILTKQTQLSKYFKISTKVFQQTW